mmetsp:Transcript_17994/g.41308  ORF Transcript_17994/g.41308 Transcript_17994/m.41308 type:complete len:83 (+) Transcript_17994:2611-2859(+)
MTENGLDDMLSALLECKDFRARDDAGDAASEALLLNAEDVRSKRRQEEDKSFMADVMRCDERRGDASTRSEIGSEEEYCNNG